MSITNILAELNESNSSLHKIAVLNKHKDNAMLKRVLQMANDTVLFTYGVTTAQIDKFTGTINKLQILEQALDKLESYFCTRKITGHAALQLAADILVNLPDEHADIVRKIINRDLRINCGKTQINKVFKNLITKPVYMRCDVYSTKTAKNIKFPAIVQLKADGTYREFSVENGEVKSRSRSGESYEYPIIFETMKSYPDGVYCGELTVKGITDRAKGNGLINSDEPPHESIVLELWDYITHDEYYRAGRRDKKDLCTKMYKTRFNELQEIVIYGSASKNVQIIQTSVVNSLKQALEITSKYMTDGFEGSILKDLSGLFKDGTSKHQLKLKVSFTVDVRITGFKPGTIGTKREGKVGAIEYKTDDEMVMGSVSGFSDEIMEIMTNSKEDYIDTIIEIEGNDLTRGVNSKTYAISHPRFIEFRKDKCTTDDLQRILDSLEMSKTLS